MILFKVSSDNPLTVTFSYLKSASRIAAGENTNNGGSIISHGSGTAKVFAQTKF